jgi:hypothetical protein
MSIPTFEANLVSEVNLPEIQEDKGISFPVTPVVTQSYDELVVTRRELWSYYCVYHYFFIIFCNTINIFSSVYSFGNNVRFPISVCSQSSGFSNLIHGSNAQALGPNSEKRTKSYSCLILWQLRYRLFLDSLPSTSHRCWI